MDRREQWVKSCLGKHAYLTEQIAKGMAKTTKKKRGITLYWYYCQFCHMWHLTRRPQ